MKKRNLYNFLTKSKKRKLRNRKKITINSSKYLRMSIFKSNRHFYAQLIDDRVGKTLVSASTIDTKIRNICNRKVNSETIKHVSFLMIERLSKINLVEKFVFDRGPYKYTGLVSQFANTLRSSGFEF